VPRYAPGIISLIVMGDLLGEEAPKTKKTRPPFEAAEHHLMHSCYLC